MKIFIGINFSTNLNKDYTQLKCNKNSAKNKTLDAWKAYLLKSNLNACHAYHVFLSNNAIISDDYKSFIEDSCHQKVKFFC